MPVARNQLQAFDTTSASNPTASDDSTQGNVVGSMWFNTTSKVAYMAVDVTPGAAIWEAATGGGPPSGPAGGDLAGTYPNPTVAKASLSFALAGVLSPAAIGSSQNNYNPTGLADASMLRLTATTAVNITGLAGGAAGRLLTIHNYGSNGIILKNEDAASTAANRFALPSTDVYLPQNASVVLQYDSTSSRWRAPSWQPPLLPAPRFFKVVANVSTTTQPPSWATLLTGNFTLTAAELNLVFVFTGSISSSNADRNLAYRILLNGTVLHGGGDRVAAANIPITIACVTQGTGTVGSNTFTVQWNISSNTANCRPTTNPNSEHANMAIWSSNP